MAVKTSGAEFKKFYNDGKYWPDGAGTYHEDVVFYMNGEELGDDKDPGEVPDDASISFAGGGVYESPIYAGKDEPTFEAYFKRWKKEQTTEVIVVECDREKLSEVLAAIKAAGGRV